MLFFIEEAIAHQPIKLPSIVNPYNTGKSFTMSNQTTFTEAYANLDKLCNQVVADRDVVIITRQEGESVALIAADELDSLMETAYLLRSPKNAARLLTALQRAKARTLDSQSINELRQELGLGEEG